MNYQVNVRDIPAVNVLLQSDGGQQLVGRYAHEVVVNALREAVDELRSAQGQLLEEEREGKPKKLNKEQLQEVLLERAEQILAEKFAPSLKKTINGTGTIIHTNLGRAKLSPVVEQALRDAAFSFSNLEYDLQEGSRGSRYQHLEDILCELTGAEAALVVNNNAAAIMLVLSCQPLSGSNFASGHMRALICTAATSASNSAIFPFCASHWQGRDFWTQ